MAAKSFPRLKRPAIFLQVWLLKAAQTIRCLRRKFVGGDDNNDDDNNDEDDNNNNVGNDDNDNVDGNIGDDNGDRANMTENNNRTMFGHSAKPRCWKETIYQIQTVANDWYSNKTY